MQDDNEIWLGFIKRDIPKWEQYDIPEKPESWYDVYCDLRERVQKEVDKDAEQLKMAMEGINSQRARHSSKFVSDVRLPQQKPSARQRYATYDRKVGGIAPVFAAPSAATLAADPLGAPAWTFERPQIPRSSESKKSGIFAAPKRNKALAVPTNKLNGKASQVRVAPRSLIEEHRRPAEPPMAMRRPTPILRVPGRPKSQPTFGSTNPVLTPSLEEKEARLRALTTGKPMASRTPKSPEATSVSSKTLPRSSPPASSFKISPTSSPVKKVLKPSPARMKPQITPAPKSPSTATPAKDSTESLFEEPGSQDGTQKLKPMNLKRPSPGPGSDWDESKSQAPRVAPIRKRPAPNVFIQPKKKKVT